MKIFDELTRTNFGNFTATHRRGIAPVEMTIVMFPLMLMMAAIVAFGFNACWKIRTEVVSRDVTWRNRHPHGNEWNANRDVRNPEFPAAREGRELEDGTGRSETSYFRSTFDDHLTTFDDDDVTNAAIIRGPLRNINVNSEILNFSRGVDLGVARILRKPNILPNMGQVDFRTTHGFLGHSFQFGEMPLIDSTITWSGLHTWSNWVRRIPYIYETDLDFVDEYPAYVNAIAQVESTRVPMCLAIDEEILYYQEFERFADYHPRIRGFTSTDRDFVRDNYVEGDRGLKLRITGGQTSRGQQVHGQPFRMASKFIRIWSSRLARATTETERNFYEAKIEALREYQQTVE